MAIFQNRTVMLIGGAVLVAFAAWYLFLRDTTATPLLQTQDLTVASEADKDVVETLLQLRAITLSGTIFTDPAFTSLKDTGIQITPEPVGRTNPFAPLSGGSPSAPSGSASSTSSTPSKPR